MLSITALLFLEGALLVAPPLSAQEEVQANLSGRLLLAGIPVDTGTVILHEVTPEVARAVDSLQVQPGGGFTFSLPHLPIPGSGEVYFVSSRYGEVLYLGDVIGEPAALDSLYIVEVFPTAPAPAAGVRFPISLREIWIEEGPLGWKITDTFYITNPTRETLIPFGEEGVVWSYPLPLGAQSVRVLDAGLVPGEVNSTDGSLFLSKPVVPGSNRIIVQYDLSSLDLDVSLPGEVEVVRVVLQEPVPPMQVEGLARMEPVEVEPGVFVSYWAGEGLLDQTISIRSGEGESALQGVIWLSIALALLLAVGGFWGVQRRSPSHAQAGLVKGSKRQRSAVLLDIARLDETFHTDERETEDYRRRRAALLQELDRHR